MWSTHVRVSEALGGVSGSCGSKKESLAHTSCLEMVTIVTGSLQRRNARHRGLCLNRPTVFQAHGLSTTDRARGPFNSQHSAPNLQGYL